MNILTPDKVPGGAAVLNPFVIVDHASDFIAFVLEVLGGTENEKARTPTPDGRLIHSEVDLGGVTLMIADRLEGWADRPGLLQVWVSNVQTVLALGESRGATVITPATPFYGATNLGRMLDPFGNLWWLYAPAPGQADPKPAWEGGSDLVFRTIDEYMKG
jgi:PhnB protein